MSKAARGAGGMVQFGVADCVGQKPVVNIRTVKSTLHNWILLAEVCCLNLSIMEFETDISLNMPSNFEVNWHPHSV